MEMTKPVASTVAKYQQWSVMLWHKVALAVSLLVSIGTIRSINDEDVKVSTVVREVTATINVKSMSINEIEDQIFQK